MESWNRIVAATFIAIALMQIFGNGGLLITLSLILLGLFLVYFFQNSLLYMPDIPNAAHSPKDNPQGYRHPSEHNLHCEQVSITTSDNINIKGWLITKESNTRLVVYFHQNAGNLGFRLPFAKNIHERTQSDVLMVAYRGYSDSEGKPSEEGIQKDAIAVMEYAVSYKKKIEQQGQRKDLYLLGRSLGGAVCVYLANLGTFKQEIKGLILENTFTSIQDMVRVIFPVLSFVQFLHRNFWPTHQRIASVQHPILFIKSMQDEMVPVEQMLKLIMAAKQSPLKEQYQIANGTHNVAWQADPKGYFNKLIEYFQKLHLDDEYLVDHLSNTIVSKHDCEIWTMRQPLVQYQSWQSIGTYRLECGTSQPQGKTATSSNSPLMASNSPLMAVHHSNRLSQHHSILRVIVNYFW